jgi:hypothetical protein
MKFKTMLEAIDWAMKNRTLINEMNCPKFDMKHPTEKDLKECGSICENHWGCHTWRHLRGSRDSEDANVREVVQFT